MRVWQAPCLWQAMPAIDTSSPVTHAPALAAVPQTRAPGFSFGDLLDVINPDALIAQTNLGRTGAPQPLDSEYLASLSADAGLVK